MSVMNFAKTPSSNLSTAKTRLSTAISIPARSLDFKKFVYASSDLINSGEVAIFAVKDTT